MRPRPAGRRPVREGLSTAARLLLGGGAALLFVGLTVVSRWLIAPLANVIGLLFVRLAATIGELARENTSRNPARTAITAGALTVGVAVVASLGPPRRRSRQHQDDR